jgi:hypothetical protein
MGHFVASSCVSNSYHVVTVALENPRRVVQDISNLFARSSNRTAPAIEAILLFRLKLELQQMKQKGSSTALSFHVDLERELGQIERTVFGADIVERADNTALQQRPERFDAIGMDLAAHVHLIPMRDNLMRVFWVQLAIK